LKVSLDLILELSADVPSEQAQKRWLGEPVRAVILPTKIFTTNAKGFPVLSPAHQLFIIKLIKVNLLISPPTKYFLLI
jgi:protein arginine N-methyltransferase 5